MECYIPVSGVESNDAFRPWGHPISTIQHVHVCMGWSLSSLQEMMKAEVAQPYIEDGSIKETAQLLLDAQAGIVEE